MNIGAFTNYVSDQRGRARRLEKGGGGVDDKTTADAGSCKGVGVRQMLTAVTKCFQKGKKKFLSNASENIGEVCQIENRRRKK